MNENNVKRFPCTYHNFEDCELYKHGDNTLDCIYMKNWITCSNEIYTENEMKKRGIKKVSLEG